jgi:putative transposase
VAVRYLALDGHFGNNNALQMVRQCGLQLISKLRCEAALHFIYDGPQKRHGTRRNYGQKINYLTIPEKYLVARSTEDGLATRIYQAKLLQRGFAQTPNVVAELVRFITKTDLPTGAFANVNLFSSDLELAYDTISDYYSLRFQVEFNFREAKQHWGLEDFRKVKEIPLTNALILSLFRVNLSQALLRQFRETHPKSGVLDLKAYFRAAKYFEETIKMLPQKPEPILLRRFSATFHL